MKAIIPVAGIGTRLQPITNKIPKVLVNVAGKPMLFHLIDELVKNKKIDTVILIIGYLGHTIIEAVNKKYNDSGLRFEFLEQKEMLGLAHAVYQAKDLFGEEPVIIILGDTIFEFDLNSFISNENSAIGVKDVEDTQRFGIVEENDGFISRMIEKPPPGLTKSKSAIAGIYFIKNAMKLFGAIEHIMNNNIKTKNEFQLTDALMKLVADGEKMVSTEIENWFDCGKAEALIATNAYILNRDWNYDQDYPFESCTFIEPVYIGEACTLNNCTIGPFATIGNGSVVTDSIIRNALVSENCTIVNAELDGTAVGAGEKVSGIHGNEVIADGQILQY
ncbi:MAG: 2-C-methyl-D-erythritol 4-phosphate cytidylyltransferase [Ignavibacteria bacterium]|nr:2-C-methyl-D-erythritol 4-phosphate cytidylyltransferase [Ignavibacteria bacterium]